MSTPEPMSRREKFAWSLATGLILALVAIGWLKQEALRYKMDDEGNLWTMGTRYRIVAVFGEGQNEAAATAIEDARAVANHIGLVMSSHLEASPLNLLNRASAGEPVALSPDVFEVLLAARKTYDLSDQAFDVTILPIIRLYRAAGEGKASPEPAAIAEAREASRWDDLELVETSVIKKRGSAGVDLGGIAKGYAIDRAVQAMQAAGVHGGLVEIGGDLRCFGTPVGGDRWFVSVQDPFHPESPGRTWCRLGLRDRAVCTSGNYRRAYVIGDQTYSHIIDPRDPQRRLASDFPASVTVVAPDAMTADAWATALSVLGVNGLDLLKREELAGVEAMIVFGGPEDHRTEMTEGFRKLLVGDAPGTDTHAATAAFGPLAGR